MRKIAPNVHAVGALDWDARLFDRLIPLPDGTSYNAYLIKGDQKTALLDTVDPSMTDVLIDNLKALKIEKIDYLISHHAEQDHSGSIPAVLKLYPQARVVANPRCKDMLIDLLHLADDKFITVEDGRELSLGDKTLQFVYLPWVHWPETMGSYLKEEKILFSCDFFGAHLATSSLFVDDPTRLYESAKRYYAEIMMPFRQQITKNLQKLQNLPINIIAPSHGPVHNNPAFIVDAYRDWVGESVKNEVVIAYVSMHGSTAKMVSFLTEALIERGIAVKRFYYRHARRLNRASSLGGLCGDVDQRPAPQDQVRLDHRLFWLGQQIGGRSARGPGPSQSRNPRAGAGAGLSRTGRLCGPGKIGPGNKEQASRNGNCQIKFTHCKRS